VDDIRARMAERFPESRHIQLYVQVGIPLLLQHPLGLRYPLWVLVEAYKGITGGVHLHPPPREDAAKDCERTGSGPYAQVGVQVV
jgi:hypothetical protein